MNPLALNRFELRPSVSRVVSGCWLILFACLWIHSAGATQVTNTTQAALASALASGGTVTFGVDGTFNLTSTLFISTDVTVDASGHSIAISGSNTVGIFSVNPGINFTLKNLSVINGQLIGTNTNNAVCGAGIYNNNGNVAVVNCVFSNNAVRGANGSCATTAGGAIFNQAGALNITNSMFLTNSSFGGASSAVTLNSQGPPAGYGYGGAVFNNLGLVYVTGTVFQGNATSGGGDYNSDGLAPGVALGNAYGGGLFTTNGTVTIAGCSFQNNQAFCQQEAGTDSDLPSGNAYGGGICQIGGSLIMRQSFFASNSVHGSDMNWYLYPAGSGFGGGLFASGILNTTNCTFIGNNASGGGYGNLAGTGNGGGLFNGGSATLVNCSIIGNFSVGGSAKQGPGADWSTEPGLGLGAGLYNSNSLVLIGSTLASNAAVGGNTLPYNYGPPISAAPGAGGGVYNSGVCLATNNTLYGNSATGGVSTEATGATGAGGGFFNNGGTVVMAFQTMFGNTAVAGTNLVSGPPGLTLGGGIYATNGSITLYNSIVASNASGGDFYAVSNSVTDGGNNLSSDASLPLTAPGSQNEVNPLLGPLANNGGATLTMLPQPGSPAIDAASSASTTPLDQRGLARPFGSASDIGAVEYYPGYSIQGVVQYVPANQPVTITAGIFSTTTDNSGNYTLNGVSAGSYSVTPSATGYIFAPASQSVSLATNANNVNFTAYQLNALTLESYINPVLRIAYAGTNSQHVVVQSSATLSNWAPILTNTVGASGIFEFQVTNTPTQPIQFFRTHSP